MQQKIQRAALLAPMLATLLTLAACSSRDESTQMPQPDQPNVEINRQGMEGATAQTAANDRRGATAIMGGAGMGPTEGGVALDARIATDVRQALQRDTELAGMTVDVSSQDGEVTLHGRARDAAARDRAGQLARDVKDVKAVENQLTVG